MCAVALQLAVFTFTPILNAFYDGWPRGWLVLTTAVASALFGGVAAGLAAVAAGAGLIWWKGAYFIPMHPGLEIFTAIALFHVFVIHRLQSTSRALVEEHAALREASSTKDRFLASLSHELRTPLNVVLGYVRMLRTTEPGLSARVAKTLEVIERNGVAQLRIIEDLLDAQRIASGRFVLQPTMVDLKRLEQAVVDALHPLAKAKGIHYLVDFDPIVTRADGARLQQVFWNLLSNAIKFTPPNGCIGVYGKQIDGKIVVKVVDSGEGIPAEFLPHVFERFRQLDDSSTRRHSGLGLGLAISKEIVELHGGQIHAWSEGPERGATFTVVLPWTGESSMATSGNPGIG